MKRAFVLSGGGNYGALQVGALQALLAHGIEPDVVVGVSAGALNAAWFAANPHPEGLQQLARIWCDSAPDYFPSPNRVSMLLRMVQGKDGLLANEPLQRFIRRWLPVGARFGFYNWPRLYVVASRLPDGAPRVFGDEPTDLLFDGLMASTALPPLYSPWKIAGKDYADGGISSDLPLQVAIERGADELFALSIHHSPRASDNVASRGVVTIGGQALSALVHQAIELEIQMVRRMPHIRLHLIRLMPGFDISFWDFAQAEKLIASGRNTTEKYLTNRPVASPRRDGRHSRPPVSLRSKVTPIGRPTSIARVFE